MVSDKRKFGIASVLVVTATLLAFQNCGKAQFQTSEASLASAAGSFSNGGQTVTPGGSTTTIPTTGTVPTPPKVPNVTPPTVTPPATTYPPPSNSGNGCSNTLMSRSHPDEQTCTNLVRGLSDSSAPRCYRGGACNVTNNTYLKSDLTHKTAEPDTFGACFQACNNPPSGLERFIRENYVNFFGREGSPEEIAHWISYYNTGGNYCQHIMRGFAESAEFFPRSKDNPSDVEYIKAMYKGILGRPADEAGLQGHLAVMVAQRSQYGKDSAHVNAVIQLVFTEEGNNRCRSFGLWLPRDPG